MSLPVSEIPRLPRPTNPQRPDPSEERLKALAADLIEAFARIARRRF
jgi:hypothetical protein